MEQKLLRLRNKEYKKIHNQWRRIHFRILFLSVIVSIIIEGIMFFWIRKVGLISSTIPTYFQRYLIFPAIMNLIFVYASFLVLTSKRILEQVKNYFISLSIVAVTFVISVVHGGLITIYGVSVIPVLLTTIYGQKKLTTITAMACLVTQFISAYFTHWDSDKTYDVVYPINITIFIIILFCVYVICMVIIEWEEKKQKIVLEKEVERQQLKHQVIRDELTGLYNRAGLREWFSKFKREGIVDYYFVMIDVDHFKNINDTWGHATGDVVLEYLGKILLYKQTDDFIPFRYGGDEFSILVRNMSLNQLIDKCEGIQEQYKGFVIVHMQGHKFSLSVGIAQNEKNLEPAKLIKQADTALYQMKCKSRGCICVYEEDK